MTWTTEDLHRLDARYAKEGVHAHQRAFRAAVELLGPAFQIISMGENPAVREIMDAWEKLFPDAATSWPGMGVGLAASVDQVRRFMAPVGYGQVSIEPWSVLGFPSVTDWQTWCRNDPGIAAESCFAVSDLLDFSYGFDDLRGSSQDALTLWHMAGSNLGDVANALPSGFSVDTITQQVCMVAELSIKAVLVHNGASPNEFKGPKGHNLSDLSQRMTSEMPHPDDALVPAVIDHLPPYVASRYAPSGLNRLAVVRLALAVQFLAASTVRRVSTRDLAAQMSANGWPAPRPAFFT
ncbi:HEPN domain-containing protein [Devosia sp. A369]